MKKYAIDDKTLLFLQKCGTYWETNMWVLSPGTDPIKIFGMLFYRSPMHEWKRLYGQFEPGYLDPSIEIYDKTYYELLTKLCKIFGNNPFHYNGALRMLFPGWYEAHSHSKLYFTIRKWIYRLGLKGYPEDYLNFFNQYKKYCKMCDYFKNNLTKSEIDRIINADKEDPTVSYRDFSYNILERLRRNLKRYC